MKPDNAGQYFKTLLVQFLYMEVRDEKKWEEIVEVANYAPLLTAKQSKILALLCKIDESGASADEKKMRLNVIEEFIRFTRFSLFSKDRMATLKISQLANLTRMFMALTRYRGR